jgi:hypothetical protein
MGDVRRSLVRAGAREYPEREGRSVCESISQAQCSLRSWSSPPRAATCPGAARATPACTCDGAGDCSLYCAGKGCAFSCAGAGDCHFDCPEGDCTVTASNAGNVYLSCEVGNCSMKCSNAGDCFITYCPTGCTCDDREEAGQCTLPPNLADAGAE